MGALRTAWDARQTLEFWVTTVHVCEMANNIAIELGRSISDGLTSNCH